MSQEIDKDKDILVTGATGFLGGAIIRELRSQGFSSILSPSRKDLPLDDWLAVSRYFESERPSYVIHAAALVGGIMRNKKYPADFGMVNSRINDNVILACHENDVEKMLFLGSSCIYPRMCEQPMREEHLMTGPLEPTNEMYALSKICGIKMCQAYRTQYGRNFISCQPSNIYGEGDHFDPENSHVVGALINKFHSAKKNGDPSVTMWGTGSAQRELLYVTDAAKACVFLMENYDGESLINVGNGTDFTIKELAERISDVVGYNGEMEWDDSKPDGMPRKVVDVTKIHALGWRHGIDLDEGLKKTYGWFLSNMEEE